MWYVVFIPIDLCIQYLNFIMCRMIQNVFEQVAVGFNQIFRKIVSGCCAIEKKP